MRACWDANPNSRPTFPEISLLLKNESLLMPDDFDAVVGKVDKLNRHTQAHIRKKATDGSYVSEHDRSGTAYGTSGATSTATRGSDGDNRSQSFGPSTSSERDPLLMSTHSSA